MDSTQFVVRSTTPISLCTLPQGPESLVCEKLCQFDFLRSCGSLLSVQFESTTTTPREAIPVICDVSPDLHPPTELLPIPGDQIFSKEVGLGTGPGGRKGISTGGWGLILLFTDVPHTHQSGSLPLVQGREGAPSTL